MVSDIVGIAPPTTDTLNELINKHPTGSVLPHIDISSFSPVSGDAELIIKLLHKFDKDTASGRSGLRVQHLLEMIAVDETFAEALSVALNTILAGKAPNEFASIFSSAPLVPLVKKDGSLRPIAVGEVLRRLLSKICLHKVMSQAVDYLSPLQVGVGVPHGVEAILLHGINRLLECQELMDTSTIIFADFKNAFNSIDRQVMLDEVRSKFPDIFPWVQYSYGCHAKLFIGSATIEASSGVQQGDPLGPFLFSLVLQPLLNQIRTSCSSPISSIPLQLVAYLDDVTIVASNAYHARECMNFLLHFGPPRGLSLSVSKSVLWAPNGLTQSLTDSFRDMDSVNISSESGVNLLGGVVSTNPSFISDSIMKRVVVTALKSCYTFLMRSVLYYSYGHVLVWQS